MSIRFNRYGSFTSFSDLIQSIVAVCAFTVIPRSLSTYVAWSALLFRDRSLLEPEECLDAELVCAARPRYCHKLLIVYPLMSIYLETFVHAIHGELFSSIITVINMSNY